jgi:hypothetical protein
MDICKVVIKEPRKYAYVKEIKNDLKILQDIVGGYIEVISIGNDILMICNEEGKFLELPYNFSMPNDIIVGTVFFIGNDAPEFRSLTEEEIELILGWF